MNSQKSVQKYDRFKLIVALILLVLFIILLLTLRGGVSPASQQVSAEQQNAAGVPSKTAAKVAEAASTPTPTPVPVTSTSTATLLPTPTATLPAPSPTPTLPPAPTSTPVPTSADSTPTLAPETAMPTPAQAGAQGDCSAAIVSRLAVGDKARVISNLNLRSSPGLEANNLVKVNPVGTQLEIIGGPTCLVYGGGVYLWWEVRMNDSQTGWSAEGSLEGKTYFLEPVK